jgi:hypothetical protein
LKKIAPKSFGQYFSEKNAPNTKKYRLNGEILPNLVTLDKRKQEVDISPRFFGGVCCRVTRYFCEKIAQ